MKKKLIRITTVPYSFRSLLKGQLKFMESHYEIIAISSPHQGYLEAFGKEENITVIPAPLTRQITPFKDLLALWQLFWVFKKEKPHIVHTHTPKAGTIGMAAAYLAGVPHRLHTIAGLPLMETTGFKRKLLDFVERLTYRCATKIYPNSEGLKDYIIKMNYTHPGKLKIIGKGSSNGVDTVRFDPSAINSKTIQDVRMSMGIKDDDFIYLFIGRLVKDKGINELVKIFNELNLGTKVKLLLVGNYEPELDPIDEETERIINNNTQIYTPGNQEDVRPYLALADVLVFPSYREGFPNVVLEAGAMGLASIVSDINGCNEIVSHGQNGLIVPSKDEQSLKEAMLSLYENDVLREKLARNAREMILENYQRPYVWEELLKEYKSLD